LSGYTGISKGVPLTSLPSRRDDRGEEVSTLIAPDHDEMDYPSILEAYNSAPPFSSPLPVSSLPTLAVVFLLAAFLLAFYSSTLPKAGLPVKEVGLAAIASIALGFGTVFAFNAVGVPV
jgi:hypothetical protein